jgi:thiamine-phosphate pyrophosphorylase
MGREVQSRLYVVAAAGTDPQALAAVLDAADVAALLIAAGADGQLTAALARPLVELVQPMGIAVLIENDAGLARVLKADGVHLAWSKDIVARYGEAREVLGTRFIVGADAGRYRDDAMTLGEAGADYIGFGIPPHVEDRASAADRRLELIAWWSEIFELPCVAFDVDTVEDAGRLAAAGADFVAVPANAAGGPSELLRFAKSVAEAATGPEAMA